MVQSIQPRFVIEDEINGKQMLRNIERAGRTCYQSEGKSTGFEADTEQFVQMIIERGHESVLEHEKVTVRIICDRGVGNELVRHRIASYSQESTRFCNYSKDKFGSEVKVIIPYGLDANQMEIWAKAMNQSEKAYFQLLESGCSPQIARSVLPLSLKTEIVITANLREWRLIFKQRTSKYAHPQMREIMVPLLKHLGQLIPVVFDNITA